VVTFPTFRPIPILFSVILKNISSIILKDYEHITITFRELRVIKVFFIIIQNERNVIYVRRKLESTK
jgi:hypothetical protein